MMTFQPGATLVLGGARSGKSTFAEKLAEASGRRKIYVATNQIFDDEMAKRVDLHKSRRGSDWVLVEEPPEIPAPDRAGLPPRWPAPLPMPM